MLKFIMNFFKRKKTLTLDDILSYPEGKRYYREVHGLKKNSMDDDALKIIHRLNRFGHKAYLVGGCIRDLLLEKKPKDYDIATSATPNQIKNVFNNCRIIGKRFRIVHVLFKGKVVEVSTFRSLPDHRYQNNSTSETDLLLKKDNNFGNAKEDAARRDFTINALYYDPRNETIIDFVDGYQDLKSKILRVVGDPDISFREDPVRMLRAVKISVLHNLHIEKETSKAIKKNKIEIEKASSSRMLEEYNKIFRTMESSLIFKGLAENHLLEVLFKEAIEFCKKDPNWVKNFLSFGLGLRLSIADRKMKEREELTPVIFYALIFSDIIKDALEKQKGNMVPTIKAALEPICKRLEIPKRDVDRLIKTFASQKRFKKSNQSNSSQNELFKAKDYFYEAFMYFKINAEAENDEEGIQAAFFWEISARIRPQTTTLIRGHRFEKKNKENFHQNQSSNQNYNQNNNQNSNQNPNPSPYKKRFEKNKPRFHKNKETESVENIEPKLPEEPKLTPTNNEENIEVVSTIETETSKQLPVAKKKRKFKPKKYRKNFKKNNQKGQSPNSGDSPKADTEEN
jgi:poly(A) polymerase